MTLGNMRANGVRSLLVYCRTCRRDVVFRVEPIPMMCRCRRSPRALVGRDDKLELLRLRWQRAEGAEWQVVLLSAEPGVGKSRLVAALRQRLAHRAG